MAYKTYTLDELFEQDDEIRRAKVKEEIAREKAEWDAKSQEEKDRIFAEQEEKWAKFEEACIASEAESDDEDEDEDDDSDEE